MTAAGDTVDSSCAGAARPKRRDAVRNQQLVVAAAREVLAQFGDDASVELIAQRAGVGVGTIYRHFPNKAALLSELVRLVIEELTHTARLAVSRDDGTGLASFLAAVGRSLSDHRGYADKLTDHVDPDADRVLHEVIAELVEQARAHGTVAASVTFDDILATIAGLRGVITGRPTQFGTPGVAWERYLAVHLAGLQVPDLGAAQHP